MAQEPDEPIVAIAECIPTHPFCVDSTRSGEFFTANAASCNNAEDSLGSDITPSSEYYSTRIQSMMV